MLKINEGDYAYAASYIRAVENKLLDSSRFERMLEATSADEAFKVLIEAEYGYSGANTENVYSFETVLAEEMNKCYSLLSEITPQIELVNAFRRRHDYFNAKVLLKAEFLGQDAPPILVDSGTVEKEAMSRIIRERDYSQLSPIMTEAIEQIYDIFSRTQDPQTVDLILDKASYRQLADDLKEIDSPFLHELADSMVDVTNIKMYIRARTINKAWDFIKKLLIEGGTIEEKIYFDNSDKSVDAFISDLYRSKYADVVQKGLELIGTKKNISELERLLDDYIMDFVRRAKMVVMGVEPLVAYLFAKEAEIRNARIIMTGKINGLPADLIRERLRSVYV
jgi:V/A-type H+-transporting ATPase subunit C